MCVKGLPSGPNCPKLAYLGLVFPPGHPQSAQDGLGVSHVQSRHAPGSDRRLDIAGVHCSSITRWSGKSFRGIQHSKKILDLAETLLDGGNGHASDAFAEYSVREKHFVRIKLRSKKRTRPEQNRILRKIEYTLIFARLHLNFSQNLRHIVYCRCSACRVNTRVCRQSHRV